MTRLVLLNTSIAPHPDVGEFLSGGRKHAIWNWFMYQSIHGHIFGTSLPHPFTYHRQGVLKDAQKIDFDTPINLDYLPDFRVKEYGVTMQLTPRDMASHRSGLPYEALADPPIDNVTVDMIHFLCLPMLRGRNWCAGSDIWSPRSH